MAAQVSGTFPELSDNMRKRLKRQLTLKREPRPVEGGVGKRPQRDDVSKPLGRASALTADSRQFGVPEMQLAGGTAVRRALSRGKAGR